MVMLSSVGTGTFDVISGRDVSASMYFMVLACCMCKNYAL